MKAVVETGSRLHLGFYLFMDNNRAFGGLGVGINKPGFRLIVEPDRDLVVVNKTNVPIEPVIENVAERLGFHSFRVIVESAIPRHAGLGSTTQLMLGLGMALLRLQGVKRVNVYRLGLMLGRGFVSGVGTGVFRHGGLVIDAGRPIINGEVKPPRKIEDYPVVIGRYRFPGKCLFIIVKPERIRGLNEEEETPILMKPWKPPISLQYRAYRALHTLIIPGVISGDCRLIGEGVRLIQEYTGEYFSRRQGGLWCCREAREIIEILRGKDGVYGYGQSSWGPAIYGLISGRDKPGFILSRVKEKILEAGIDAEVFLAEPLNRGARVKICPG